MAKGIEGIGLKVSETLVISMKPRLKSWRKFHCKILGAYHPEQNFTVHSYMCCFLQISVSSAKSSSIQSCSTEPRHCRSCHENSYHGQPSPGNLQLVNNAASYWEEHHQQYPTTHPCDESTQHSPSLDLVLSNSGIVFVQFFRCV